MIQLPRLITAATYADLLRARRLLAGMGFSGSLTAAVHELGRTLESLRLERDAAEREAARFRPKPLEWQKAGRGNVATAKVTPSGEIYARVSPGVDGWTASVWVLGSAHPPLSGYRVRVAESRDEADAKAKAGELAREVLYG